MCAINGILWSDEKMVQKMNQKTSHRGPDGTRALNLPNATFGHNRLSIIDPDPRSNQPMQTDDGRYTIIYNGEIYNFKELRNKLHNSKFKTESDTEVILNGFKEWGTDVFKKLNGMYALAIFDKENGEVTLARDPIGIKPLYTTKTKNGFAFSSEIKALLEVGIERKLDYDSFSLYMRTLYVPGPRTMFKDVEKFPPGHFATIKDGNITYHSFQYEAESLEPKNSVELKALVENAVSRQLISDRPLGVYLSGGIDSTSVLASATKAKGQMETFSVGFELNESEESEKFNADSVLAKRVAEYFGAKHHEFLIKPEEVFSLLEQAVYSLDEPIANATIAPQIALSQFAREKVVVTLTGDGGDEVFGGYERYRLSRLMDLYQTLVPNFVSGLIPNEKIKKLSVRKMDERYKLFHYQKDEEISHILSNSLSNTPSVFSEELLKSISRNGALMHADRKSWLVDESLMRSDKLGMAHGLETRPPLLDLEIVSAMQNVPFKKQVSYTNTKLLLKEAFKNELPDWILNQPKRGWFSPGAKWLRNESFYRTAKQAFTSEYAPGTSSLFNWGHVQKMLNEHKERKGYHATALLSILMFQLWSRSFSVEV